MYCTSWSWGTTIDKTHSHGLEYLYPYCSFAFLPISASSSSFCLNSGSSFSLSWCRLFTIWLSLGTAHPFCTAGRLLMRSHHL